MSKKKKKHKTRTASDASLSLQAKRRNGQKILIMLGLFVVFELVYQLILQLEKKLWPLYPVSIYVLSSIVAVLFITFFVMNRGDSPRMRYTSDDFDKTIPLSQREEMAQRYNAQKERAKILVYFIVPLSFVLAIDFIFIFSGIGMLW